MKRYITLPGGRAVSLATYLEGWRYLKTADPDESFPNWNWHGNQAADILRAIRQGVDDRVNRHDRTRPATWRKLDPNYQRDLRRAAHELNTPRLVIHWLPKDLKGRFQHRLRNGEDY